MANLAALQQKESMLVDKLARLKTGEMNCEEREGDGRQEEAIARSEKFLRDVRKEIAATPVAVETKPKK